MNVVVVALSFLAEGSRSFCPPACRAGAPLSTLQWELVSGLEEDLAQWSPFDLGDDGLKCGRKGAELADAVRFLEGLASQLGPPASYSSRGPPGSTTSRTFLPVVAERMKFPEHVENLDLSPWLPDDLWMAYVSPQALRSLPRRAPTWRRPAPRHLSAEEFSLLRLWQRAGRLGVTDAVGLPAHRFAALAAVAKSPDEDRQIIDRRGANGEEDKVAGPSKWLPGAADLVDIVLKAGEKLVCGGADLAHCYHQVQVSAARASTNPVGKPLSVRRCFAEGVGEILPAAWAGQLEKPVALTFQGLPMGDHAAVELVHAAHGALLEDAGLLAAEEVRGGEALPRGRRWQLRCIDDYKVLAAVGRDVPLDGPSAADRPDRRALDRALRQYLDQGWPISPAKVVKDTTDDVVLGGEVLGEGGTVGMPRQRRFVLMLLLLRAAALPWTSAGLLESLLGSVTYGFLFRRPLLAVLEETFGLARSPTRSMQAFPRSAAQELVLSAILLAVAHSDLRAPVVPRAFASDASPSGGGLVSTTLSGEQAEELFRLRERRGGFSRLEAPARSALRELGVLGVAGTMEEQAVFPDVPVGPPRPIAFTFAFLEISGGAGALTTAVAALGVASSPPFGRGLLDRARPDSRGWSWLVWVIKQGFLRCLFATAVPATAEVESLFLRGLCARHGVIFVEEVVAPKDSAARGRLALSSLAQGFEEAVEVEPCSLGLPWRARRLLRGVGVPLAGLRRRCPGFHRHCSPPGADTSSAADLVPELAEEWARLLAGRIRAVTKEAGEDREKLGYETAVVNMVADSSAWSLEKRWRWRRPDHINVLEQRALHVLVKRCVQQRVRGRLSVLLDSRVVLCSGGKGRSPSRVLCRRWRHTLPWLIGGRVYLGLHFVPTRKNRSDGPSRFREIAPISGLAPAAWLRGAFDGRVWSRWLAARGCSRGRAGWARLVLGLLERLSALELLAWPPRPEATDGEARVPGPRGADWRPRRPLVAGRSRRLAPEEQQRRAAVIEEFSAFVAPTRFEDLIENADECGRALEAFGQRLYAQLPRRPLGDFSRAILAVTDRRRELRRHLVRAWDFAWLWKDEEPGLNRLAMPAVVLRAFVALALHWGWFSVAALMGAAFAGIMRPSEVLTASRGLVVLPRDIQGPWFRSFVRVPLPKSRWCAARRQLARIDDWWVTALLDGLYGKAAPDTRLWPASPASFRSRWDALARALHVDSRQSSGLTPASLRAGGATSHFEIHEDIDKLMKRARWRRGDTADIYVQEVAPYEYLSQLPESRRRFIFEVAGHFDAELWRALRVLAPLCTTPLRPPASVS